MIGYIGKVTSAEAPYLYNYTVPDVSNVYGVAFNDYEDYIDGIVSTASSLKGKRFGLAKNFEFEPSTTTYSGRDDFITNNVAPFCPRECVTQLVSGSQVVVAYEGDPDWDTLKNDSNYNRMIEFPKFYYCRNDTYQFAITPEKIVGICDTPSPMHYRNGKLYDYVYISKYLLNKNYASVYGTDSYRAVNTATRRTKTREQGMYLMDYPAAASLAMLMLVKYANLDAKSVVGYSPTSATVAGLGDAILSKDGRVESNVTDPGVTVAFGLENYWGRVGTYCDGFFKNKDHKMIICNDITTLTSDPATGTSVPSGYTLVDIEIDTGSNGWIKELSFNETFPYMLLPTTHYGLNTENKSINQTFNYIASGLRTVYVGGNSDNSKTCGPFRLYISATLDSTTATLGMRGMFFSTTYSNA